MRKLLMAVVSLLVVFHAGHTTAADVPHPHRWYDKYSEIQVFGPYGEMVADLNYYFADGDWYNNMTGHAENPGSYAGRGYGIVKIK